MGMFFEFIKWTVLTQGMLLLVCMYFESQANSVYAIFLFSSPYFFCLLISFALSFYYAKNFLVNILGREIGSRQKQMNKKYKADHNLK